MKIIMPTRGCISFLFILISFIFPTYVQAQCTSCADTQQELEGCNTNPEMDNDATFDLTTVTLSNGSHTADYFENCDPMDQTLTGNIGNSGNYMADDQTVIYVQEMDGATCIQIIEVTLDVHSLIVDIDAPITDICPNQSVTLSADVTGGEGTLVYAWSVPNGQSNPGDNDSFMANTGGSYIVSVTDQGCTRQSDPVSLDEIDLEVNISPTVGNVCPGEPETLTANVTGGSGGITYSWVTPAGQSDPKDEQDIDADVVGIFSVDVTRNGCTVSADDPAVLSGSDHTVEIDASGLLLCEGSSSVTLTADITDSGSGPYMYEWATASGSSPTTAQIVAGTAGDYNLTVTKNGCEAVAMTVTLEDESITDIDLTRTNVTCAGGNDGELEIDVTGGSGNYEYELSNGMTQSGASPYDFTGLMSGNYTVTVTDLAAPMCSSTAGPIFIDDGRNVTMSLTKMDPSTVGGSDGEIDVVVSGGTSQYAWSWTRTNPSGSDNGDTENGSSFTIDNLPAGDYVVTVMDDADSPPGCTVVENITLNSIVCDLNVSSPIPTSPSCRDGNDGSIQVDVDGAIGVYTIAWSGPVSDDDDNETASTYTIPGLLPGNYGITVSDVANCTDVISSVTVVNPTAFSFDADQDRPSCATIENGIISVSNISNGQPPYEIEWSGTESGDESTGSTSFDIIDLNDGTYNITVTDNNNCSAVVTNVTVGVFPAIDFDIVGDVIFCDGEGSSTISTSPAGFQSYSWDPGGSQPSVSVSNPGNDNSLIYRVTVTDNNDCTASEQIQAVGLNPITISLNSGSSKTSVTCSSDCDGRIDIDVSGGTGTGYSYTWSGPGNLPNQADINLLCPGDYDLTVTDSEGCTATFSQTITVPDAISVAAVSSPATCNGFSDGEIQLTVQGGTSPYTYDWSAPIVQNTKDVSNVSAGTYTVTVTDFNDCFVVETVTVNEPQEVIAEISPSMANICIGDEITLEADGGTSYQWSGGEGNNQEITVSPNSTTTYTVTVTDAQTNNCTATATIDVTVNPLPVVNIDVSETSGSINDDAEICDGDNIRLTATGGTMYTWTGGNSNPYTLSPEPGTSSYTVTVTDANGCVSTASQEVNVSLNPRANFGFVLDNPTLIIGDAQRLESKSQAFCGDLVSCLWEIDENEDEDNCGEVAPVFNSLGAQNVKLTVENSCGCTDVFEDDLIIEATDQCAITNFVINDNDDFACVNQQVPYIALDKNAGGDCMIVSREYRVFRDNVEMTLGDEFLINSNFLVFKEVGIYEITYTIRDNICGCEKSSTKSIEVLAPPDISFAASNPVQGCQGQVLTISFDDFDSDDRVRVEFENGESFLYENQSFEFAPSGVGPTTLKIVSVDIGTCEVPVTGEVLEIDILPAFEIVSKKELDCDEVALTYSFEAEFAGGDPSASVIAEGIEGGVIIGNNIFQVNNLEPGVVYEFTLRRGDICEGELITVFKPQCDCFFDVGDREVRDLVGCEETVFDISNVFNTMTDSSEFDPLVDTFVYFLHLSLGDGPTLGTVHHILPGETTVLSNDFPLFLSGVTYKLSAVGIKRASLESGAIVLDPKDPLVWSNTGRAECLSVEGGTNVLWQKTPEPVIRTQGSSNTICRNANDFLVYATNTRSNGSDIKFEVLGLPDGNINIYGSQDSAYIYFEDSGQDSFQVVLTETVSSDGNSCVGMDTLTLYVRNDQGAPPLSEIILWPGNIFASTADSTTTCFEWRLYRQGVFSSILSTDKYFFADKDADIVNSNDIFFVDTYFCDNPDCVTRVFFNNDRPLPGLHYKEEDGFQYLIKPNPNDGIFELSLFSDTESNYVISLFDVTGKAIHSENAKVFRAENKMQFDFQGIAKGIYFMRIMDLSTNNYSTEKVVIH